MTRDELLKDLDFATKAGDEQLASAIMADLDRIDGKSVPKAKPSGGFLDAMRSGVYKGALTNIPGIAADTGANVLDLLKMPVGAAYHGITGKGIPEWLAPYDRSKVVGSSQWLQDKIASSDFGNEVINAGATQYPGLHAAGQAAGASMGARVPAAPFVAAPTGLLSQKVQEGTGSNEAAILTSLLTPATIQTTTRAISSRPPLVMASAQKQAEAALRPYTPQQITDAIKLQQEASRFKNPISASQALGGSGRVKDLEEYTVDAPSAPKSMLQDIQSQPARSRSFAQSLASTFGPANRSLVRANEIEAAADKVMEMPRAAAHKAVQPLYEAIKIARPQLPESVRWKLAGDLEDLNKNVGLLEQSAAGRAVKDVSRRATSESVIVNPQGKAFRRAEGDIYELDNYLKEIRTRIEALSKVNPDAKQLVERAGLSPAASNIRSALLDNSNTLRVAKDRYQFIKNTLDATVRSTAIPDMSRRFNAPDVSTKTASSWTSLEKLVNRQQSPQDLGRAVAMLSKQDKNAIVDVTKNILRQKADDSFVSSVADPTDTARFVRAVKDTPNLSKAIELTAKAQGMAKPKDVATGFMRLLDIAEASTMPRGAPGGGATAKQIETQGVGKSAVSFALGSGLAKSATAVRNVQYLLNKKEIEILVKTLDSPDSLQNLQKLANATPATAQKIVADILNPPASQQMTTLWSLIPEFAN